VDAAVALDERTDADGEVVWSWRPDAGAKLSQEAIPAEVTGAKEPGPRGEHDISRKTIAQGRPADGTTCGDYRVLSTNAHGPRVRAEHPVFPAPSCFQGG
jgi:hypothetical protein